MSIRNVLIGLGILALLCITAERVMRHIGNLEADNAQLQQQIAELAKQRKIDAAVLVQNDTRQRQSKAELAGNVAAMVQAYRNGDEGERSWADAALPDDIARMLAKSKPGGRTDAAGQPVSGAASAGAQGHD